MSTLSSVAALQVVVFVTTTGVTNDNNVGTMALNFQWCVKQNMPKYCKSFLQEWSLHNHVDAHMQDTEPDPTDSRPRHPRLFVFCHATRKPGYFLFNIVLVMVSLTPVAMNFF